MDRSRVTAGLMAGCARGSPESKPVGAPHETTGVEG
jgi:hypothetical protein